MVASIIISIIFLSFVLIKSADLVIVAVRRLSRETSKKSFVISALILAIGTSFPELSVAINSALEKASNLTLGAVAGILPLILIIDRVLSRVDGLILLACYFAYALSFFRHRFLQISQEQREEGFIYRFTRRFNNINAEKKREIGKLFVGIALLLFSADYIVKLSLSLAHAANIPIFFIGLVLLAVGTSLPEFAFSLRSIEDHEPAMFFGNLLGSTIANSTLIIVEFG